MSATKKEYTSDDLYNFVFQQFGAVTTPTPGQFRTWLEESKGIEIDYNRAKVATERLKRFRLRGEQKREISGISKTNTARSSRNHGK